MNDRGSYRYSRNVGREGLEVVERCCRVPNHKVDGDEETAKDDAEASTDDRKENIFLEQNGIPSLIDICRPDRTN